MMRSAAIVALCAFAVQNPVFVSTAALEGSETDRSAIVRVIDDEGAAWKAGDANAFAAHALPDISFVNTVGMYSVGKAPFVAQHELIFSTIYKGSQARQYIVSVIFVKPDVAIVETIAKLSGFQQLPTGASAVDDALYTRLQQVMVKRGGLWSVAAFHNVPIQPKFVTEEVRSITSGAGH